MLLDLIKAGCYGGFSVVQKGLALDAIHAGIDQNFVMPYICFEHAKPGLRGRRPEINMRRHGGGLNPRWIGDLEKVSVAQTTRRRQVWKGKEWDDTLHHGLDGNDLLDHEYCSLYFGLPWQCVKNDETFIDLDSPMSVINEGTPEFTPRLDELTASIPWEALALKLVKADQSERGNRQFGIGYTGQSWDREEDGITRPQKFSGTDDPVIRELFGTLTQVYLEITGKTEEELMSDEYFANRQRKFAAQLSDVFNGKESATVAGNVQCLGKDPNNIVIPEKLKDPVLTHFDRYNCPILNDTTNCCNGVVVQHDETGDYYYVRVSIIAYWKLQIGLTLSKEEWMEVALGKAEEEMRERIESGSFLEDSLPSPQVGSIEVPINPDKAELYSQNRDSANPLIKKFSKQFTKSICTELAYGSALSNNPVHSRFVFDKWSHKKQLPAGNLTLAFLESCVAAFGSMSGGDNPRWVPFLNDSVTVSEIAKSLAFLHKEIEELNGLRLTNSEISDKYAKLCESWSAVMFGMGNLSVQTLIHGLVNFGIIHDSRFGEQGYISTSTKAHKQLKKLLYDFYVEKGHPDPNKAAAVINKQDKRVQLVDTCAARLSKVFNRTVTPRVAENILCKAMVRSAGGNQRRTRKYTDDVLYIPTAGEILYKEGFNGNLQKLKSLKLKLQDESVRQTAMKWWEPKFDVEKYCAKHDRVIPLTVSERKFVALPLDDQVLMLKNMSLAGAKKRYNTIRESLSYDLRLVFETILREKSAADRDRKRAREEWESLQTNATKRLKVSDIQRKRFPAKLFDTNSRTRLSEPEIATISARFGGVMTPTKFSATPYLTKTKDKATAQPFVEAGPKRRGAGTEISLARRIFKACPIPSHDPCTPQFVYQKILYGNDSKHVDLRVVPEIMRRYPTYFSPRDKCDFSAIRKFFGAETVKSTRNIGRLMGRGVSSYLVPVSNADTKKYALWRAYGSANSPFPGFTPDARLADVLPNVVAQDKASGQLLFQRMEHAVWACAIAASLYSPSVPGSNIVPLSGVAELAFRHRQGPMLNLLMDAPQRRVTRSNSAAASRESEAPKTEEGRYAGQRVYLLKVKNSPKHTRAQEMGVLLFDNRSGNFYMAGLSGPKGLGDSFTTMVGVKRVRSCIESTVLSNNGYGCISLQVPAFR